MYYTISDLLSYGVMVTTDGFEPSVLGSSPSGTSKNIGGVPEWLKGAVC